MDPSFRYPRPHTIQTAKLLLGDQACLQLAAEKMAQCSTSSTAEVRDKTLGMIDECIREMQADNLSQDLLLYVSRIIREARTALEEYDLTGDFKLSVVFNRLRNVIRIVEGEKHCNEKVAIRLERIRRAVARASGRRRNIHHAHCLWCSAADRLLKSDRIDSKAFNS